MMVVSVVVGVVNVIGMVGMILVHNDSDGLRWQCWW